MHHFYVSGVHGLQGDRHTSFVETALASFVAERVLPCFLGDPGLH